MSSHERSKGFTGEPQVEIISGGHEIDPIALTIGNMAVAVERARHASDMLAESYRRFNVGGTGFAYNAENGQTAMITAANFKQRLDSDEIDQFDVKDGNIPKFCAEMNIVKAAYELGYTRLIALAVVGTADQRKIEAVTFRKTDTLHPCDDCRNVFHYSDLIDRNTQIITVGFQDKDEERDVDVFQSQTYRQLARRYGLPLHRFKDAPSAPYVPYEWNERHQLYLAERNELEIPSLAELPGDISRNRKLVQLGKRAMSAELELTA